MNNRVQQGSQDVQPFQSAIPSLLSPLPVRPIVQQSNQMLQNYHMPCVSQSSVQQPVSSSQAGYQPRAQVSYPPRSS